MRWILVAALLVVAACRVYAPITVDVTVCAEGVAAGLLTAKAAEELSKATDACLEAAHGEAVRRATDPDAGVASVERHSWLVQWILDAIEKRRHHDGGVR